MNHDVGGFSPALLEDLLAALQATFGQHPGHRTTHAKGLMATGTFTASPAAASLCRAAHFQGQDVPITLRFSNFSGIPQTPDGDPTASPRGLGVRFSPGAGLETDIVAHSFDGFPVGTPRGFLQFLQGIAASLAEPPDPAPLDRFLAAHASARAYLAAPKPAPRSYASTPYYGINAFHLIGANGELASGRYRIDPLSLAPAHWPDEEAVALAPDYLASELSGRLRLAPLSMRLVFQLAAAEDELADGSISWPHQGPQARREVVLGDIRIESLVEEQIAAARRLDLDPGRLIEGLMLSDDPMVPLRSALYRLAASRRG